MRIAVNSRGVYVSKNGECFEFNVEDKKTKLPAKDIEQIMISTSATITTDSIKLALENNIDIVILDYFGNPVGRFWHSKISNISTIRRHQLSLDKCAFGV